MIVWHIFRSSFLRNNLPVARKHYSCHHAPAHPYPHHYQHQHFQHHHHNLPHKVPCQESCHNAGSFVQRQLQRSTAPVQETSLAWSQTTSSCRVYTLYASTCRIACKIDWTLKQDETTQLWLHIELHSTSRLACYIDEMFKRSTVQGACCARSSSLKSTWRQVDDSPGPNQNPWKARASLTSWEWHMPENKVSS